MVEFAHGGTGLVSEKGCVDARKVEFVVLTQPLDFCEQEWCVCYELSVCYTLTIEFVSISQNDNISNTKKTVIGINIV